MNPFLLIVFLLFLIQPAEAGKFRGVVECPIAGHPTCSDGRENDGISGIDPAPHAMAFGAVEAGYAAEMEDCPCSLEWEEVADASASGGAYMRLKDGTPPGAGECACCGNFANGSYYLTPQVSVPSPDSGDPYNLIWVSAQSRNRPTNAESSALAGGETLDFTPGPIGADFLPNFTHGTAQATYALNGDSCLYIHSQSAIAIDNLYLSTSPTANPVYPAAAVIPDYIILEEGSQTAPVSIDGVCDEPAWGAGGANQVPTAGFSDSNNTNVNIRLLWQNDTTDRLKLCASVNDEEFDATVDSNDGSVFSNDSIEIQWCDDQPAIRHEDCFKLTVSISASTAFLDANYPSGTETVAYDGNTTCAKSITGTLNDGANDTSYLVECVIDLGFDSAGGQFVLGNVHMIDKDTATADGDLLAFSPTDASANDISTWGLFEISSTSLSDLGAGTDTTAPTMGAPTVVTNSETTCTISSTTTEPVICQLNYEASPAGDPGAPYANLSGTNSSSGGLCQITLSGLTASTRYWARMNGTDAAQNVGNSSSVSCDTDVAPGGGAFATNPPGSLFTEQSTLYTPIPADHVKANSATLVGFLLEESDKINLNSTTAANSFCVATESDPRIDISPEPTTRITSTAWVQGYDQDIPMPASCEPPTDVVNSGTDRIVMVWCDDCLDAASQDYVWGFYKSIKDSDTAWRANTVWKIPKDGPGHHECTSSCPSGSVTCYRNADPCWNTSDSACSQKPRTPTMVSRAALDAGLIEHVLSFETLMNANKGATHTGGDQSWMYPCKSSNFSGGACSGDDCLYYGQRFQMDPTIDIESPTFSSNSTVDAYIKAIMKAAQTYGLILMEGKPAGNHGIQIESSATAGAYPSSFAQDFRAASPLIMNNLQAVYCVPGIAGDQCPALESKP